MATVPSERLDDYETMGGRTMANTKRILPEDSANPRLVSAVAEEADKKVRKKRPRGREKPPPRTSPPSPLAPPSLPAP